MDSKELIKEQIQKILSEIESSFEDVKNLALAEAWKVLQLLVAVVIQVIEKIGTDLSGPEKKQAALEAIEKFYDSILSNIDIPWIPGVFEPLLHNTVKELLMLLVGSTIDAMVSTFRNVGVFEAKLIGSQGEDEDKILTDLLNDISRIVKA